MKKYLRHAYFAVSFSLLSGCMVGPDYESPDESVGLKELSEPVYSNAPQSWKTAAPADRKPRGNWWTVFKDPVLDSLIERCRADNPDLKSLFYKVEQARENACMDESMLYPHINGGASYLRAGMSEHAVFRQLQTFDDWFTGASLTWDADLFGRVRSMLKSDRANAVALRDEYENMLMILQAQVATTYFSLRELVSERELFGRTVKIRTGETAFIRNRLDARSASDADLQRAIEQEYSARADLSAIEAQLALAKNYLANLIGIVPSKLEIVPCGLSSDVPEIPSAIPSELLERRPDIAAAERRVCAANYRIGAAQAAFYPTVTITGALGTESTAFSKLIASSSFEWGIAPQIYIPIFQAGRLIAQKRVALAKHQQAVQDYRAVVLKAVREVEDSLVKTRRLKEQYAARSAAAVAAKKVEYYAAEQYKAGVADYFAASEAHRYALMNELGRIKIRGEQYRAAISLVRSLGGSWRRPQDPKEGGSSLLGIENISIGD